MKILPISLNSFKARYIAKNQDENFMYHLELKDKKDHNKMLKQYSLATASSAVIAVCVALFNLGRKHKFPKNIVEIPDLDKGLNKIKNQDKFIRTVKTKFLYPLKALILGDNRLRKSRKLKTGIVITGNTSDIKDVYNAFSEHISELKIDVVKINPQISRKTKDGKIIFKDKKRTTIVKEFKKEIDKAKEKFRQTGKYTVIFLGELDNATNMYIAKSKHSKFDEYLINLTKDKTSGVIWAAYTSNGKTLPIYFKDLPVTVTKLEG